jgi:arginine decarboxylase
MTCDSDGMVKSYVENEGLDSSLPLHALRSGESYRLGIFLVGAYQEILGDIHNLFGDTDAVEVSADAGTGYLITQQRRGDTTDVMLDYVGYALDDLRAVYRQRVEEAGLPAADAGLLADALEAGLTGYTYLSDEPLA